MDTAEIEAFLVLAEELHFARTAERLHVSQPRVSRLVATLERKIGGKLFDRTTRQVRLTLLGEQFRGQLQPAWSQVSAAYHDARAAARGVTGSLRAGCPYIVEGQAVTRLVKEFCARYPDCELILHATEPADPYPPLRRGDIDVLVNWQVVEEPDLTVGPAIEYRDRVLAVAQGHRLAGRQSVSVEDLGDEETIQKAPALPQALFDMFTPPVTPSGRPIRRTYPWRSVEDIFTSVARGQIVHATMTGVALTMRPDLVLVPIRDLPPVPLGLIWCTAHENARIRALAATAAAITPSPAGQANPAGQGHLQRAQDE